MLKDLRGYAIMSRLCRRYGVFRRAMRYAA